MNNWIFVGPGKLPHKDQEILFIVDYRGSPDGDWRDVFNTMIKGKDRQFIQVGYVAVDLFPPYPEQKVFVKHGWVHTLYSDCFTVRRTETYNSILGMEETKVELITYWQPMPKIPNPDITQQEATELYEQRNSMIRESCAREDAEEMRKLSEMEI